MAQPKINKLHIVRGTLKKKERLAVERIPTGLERGRREKARDQLNYYNSQASDIDSLALDASIWSRRRQMEGL